MRFVKYNSIENILREENINAIIEQGFSGGEWCASNKIHGANLSFWCDSTEVRAARRSGFLGKDGSGLYNSQTVFHNYSGTMRDMYNYFQAQFVFDAMVVYGELFGGSYPHPEVDRIKNASKVQDGVFYCPHNDFYMFDVAFYIKDVLIFFLSKTTIAFLGEKFDIPYLNIMYKGTFQEMLALNPIFEDPTYSKYNLPKIENNMSEGLVISPVDTKFFNGGSRVILKSKNPNFSENKDKKDKKWSENLSPEVADLINEGSTYITENRLKNVLSHGHSLKGSDFGKLLGALAEDVFQEFSKDFGNRLTELSKADKKYVNSSLNKEMANLIRKSFINILDGNF